DWLEVSLRASLLSGITTKRQSTRVVGSIAPTTRDRNLVPACEITGLSRSAACQGPPRGPELSRSSIPHRGRRFRRMRALRRLQSPAAAAAVLLVLAACSGSSQGTGTA